MRPDLFDKLVVVDSSPFVNKKSIKVIKLRNDLFYFRDSDIYIFFRDGVSYERLVRDLEKLKRI